MTVVTTLAIMSVAVMTAITARLVTMQWCLMMVLLSAVAVAMTKTLAGGDFVRDVVSLLVTMVMEMVLTMVVMMVLVGMMLTMAQWQ